MEKIKEQKTKYIAIAILIIIGIYYIHTKEESYIESNTNIIINAKNIEETTNKEENISNKIIIYITGAIKKEGIYETEEKSRIADCIELAGGITEEADIHNLNLADIVEDGMKIHIPAKGEEKDNSIQVSTNNTSELKKNTKINLNTATQSELETLPGIGPSTATKIITYREKNGKFTKIEDIKKISGIGENKYSKIKELIKV